MTFHAAFPTVTTQRTVLSIPEQTFDFLEKPEFYFDGYHLNSKGRQRFTETLVTELVGRLRSRDSNKGVRANSNGLTDQVQSVKAGSDADKSINDPVNNSPATSAPGY
jgi:hypothetical protein